MEMRSLFHIPRERAMRLGVSAVQAATRGSYTTESGQIVDWKLLVDHAKSSKRSIPPEASLPCIAPAAFTRTDVQVCNASTLQVGKRLVNAGLKPLALNMANGITPGGGFLNGALAQEESLCRTSALYETLEGDPMYAFHLDRPEPDSSDWMILSPATPVFRNDAGTELERPWLLDFVTAAAPYAPRIGQPRSGDLLQRRIRRLLAVTAAHGYEALILGAWGCGAFGNDPHRTANDFRSTLEIEFAGCFRSIVFAITDWSPGRRFLGPFRKAFRS